MQPGTYPEASVYDSNPQQGCSPAWEVGAVDQGRHDIDDAMPTAVQHTSPSGMYTVPEYNGCTAFDVMHCLL